MIIGLTGSMAAGKSTVSALLRARGFFIIDADKVAHTVLKEPAVIAALADAFGSDILTAEGGVDRAKLAEKAFAAAENTEKLNSIVHPAVIERMLDSAEEFLLEYPEIPVVFDVPLLFESGMDKYCDRVLAVAADDELRYRRIMERDGLSREQAALRIARQMPQEEKLARADAAIFNNGDLPELSGALTEALHRIGVYWPEAEAPSDDAGDYGSDDNDGA